MIDDRTVYYLLDHIVCEVMRAMHDGKTLEEIDDRNLGALRKVDRIALYERMVELKLGGEEGDAIVAHLRALKRRKRSPHRPPAAILSFRPEDRSPL